MKFFFAIFVILILTTLTAAAAEIPLALRVTKTVTSENLNLQDGIPAELVSNIVVNGETLFKKGSPARLFIKTVTKSARMGKGGYIESRKGVIMDINDDEHLITTRLQVQGDDKDWIIPTVTLCTLTIILIPFDLVGLKKGYPAIIQEGTVVDCVIQN